MLIKSSKRKFGEIITSLGCAEWSGAFESPGTQQTLRINWSQLIKEKK